MIRLSNVCNCRGFLAGVDGASYDTDDSIEVSAVARVGGDAHIILPEIRRLDAADRAMAVGSRGPFAQSLRKLHSLLAVVTRLREDDSTCFQTKLMSAACSQELLGLFSRDVGYDAADYCIVIDGPLEPDIRCHDYLSLAGKGYFTFTI